MDLPRGPFHNLRTIDLIFEDFHMVTYAPKDVLSNKTAEQVTGWLRAAMEGFEVTRDVPWCRVAS